MIRCLVAGPGGAGSSTAARVVALAAARDRPTVLVTDDPIDPPAPDGPHELRTVRPDPAAVPRALLLALRAAPAGTTGDGDVAATGGALEGITAEELADLPGVPELALLLTLADVVRGAGAPGASPAVVVDAGSRALALLSLTERFGHVIDELLPPALRFAGALTGHARDPLGTVLDLVAPAAALLQSCRGLLVLPPDPVRAARAAVLRPQLALHGVALAGALVLAGGATAGGHLPLPGTAVLPVDDPDVAADAVAQLWSAAPGPAVHHPPVTREGEHYGWALPLPGVDRDALDLQRSGDDLVLAVAGTVRRLPLPSLLARCRVESAALVDDELRLQFSRDPARWPTVLGGDGLAS